MRGVAFASGLVPGHPGTFRTAFLTAPDPETAERYAILQLALYGNQIINVALTLDSLTRLRDGASAILDTAAQLTAAGQN